MNMSNQKMKSLLDDILKLYLGDFEDAYRYSLLYGTSAIQQSKYRPETAYFWFDESKETEKRKGYILPPEEGISYTSPPSIPYSQKKEQSFVLLEIKSLSEILSEYPNATFDDMGDLFSTKEEADHDEYAENYLDANKLQNLGNVVQVFEDELNEWPTWVIKRNLGR
jgi:hypothetical protein